MRLSHPDHRPALLCGVVMAAAIASLGFAAAAAGDNWPQWRGPGGAGVSPSVSLPDDWSPTSNVRWKTPLPGRGHSSPIVWGRRVFLTAEIEGEVIAGAKPVTHVRRGQVYVHPDSVSGNRLQTLKVICLDRDSGKILWERTAYQGPVNDDRHRKGSYASGTPATDGRHVYAFFEAEGLYCYDVEGRLVWKTSIGRVAKMGLGPGVSPVIYRDLVLIQCDQEDGGPDVGSFIAAIDKRTGREVWRRPRDHRKTWATPLVIETGGRSELIASGAESVIAYDPLTGRELWRTEGVDGHAIPSAVTIPGLVFLTAGYPSKRALAIRLGELPKTSAANSADASADASASRIAWRHEKGTAYVTSPILYGDYFYIVSDKGVITCFEARTGRLVYEGGRVPVPASFTSSAVAFDGKLLLTSEDGDTFVIRAGPKHEVLRTNSVGEPVLSSLAIADGRIFIRGERHLFCIGR